MATSTNFGWTEPDDTDLVKNGASAMRTLGNAIDSSLYTISGGIAGKNKIINGDFGIWQRGTSFASGTSTQFTADRWLVERGSGTYSVSQQTFTPATAPVSGYEGTYFFRISPTVAGDLGVGQRIEDVRTFANQQVTFSFWAKASTATTLQYLVFNQYFGSGGSATVYNTYSFTDSAVTTSWKRFSVTFTVPSISGKTIGTGSYAYPRIDIAETFTGDFDIWGVQWEAGSTATPFQTATGTKQGELAACQRYYWRAGGDSVYQYFGQGSFYSSTGAYIALNSPVPMRVAPSSLEYSTLQTYDYSGTQTINNITMAVQSKLMTVLDVTLASGGTQFRPNYIRANNSTSAYIALNAEL